MILVFGGAYQGKTDYAKKVLGVKSVCDVSEGGRIDFTKDAIAGLEDFALQCVKDGEEAMEYFAEREDEWKDKVLILTDISQGVVPVDRDVRKAREMNGRLMLYLAGKADEVHRVFCGIGKRIK